tara:strand:+ start:407 stop:1192 length:786 start_codon:yes stop_codon:yes gene_type:complete
MPDYSRTRIQIRRGTASEWDETTILGEGELAYVTDIGILKVGDGTSEFDALSPIGGGSMSSLSLDMDPTLVSDLKLNSNKITGNGDILVNVGDLSLLDGNVTVSGDITCNGTFTLNGSSIASVEDVRTTANHEILGSTDIENWTPSVQADVLRVDTTGHINIHGLSTSYYNKNQLTVSNNGPDSITFANDSSTATAENRFYNTPSEDIVLASGETIVMTYDDSYDRWLNYTVARNTRIIQLTENEYNTLSAVDPNTVYVVT